MPPAAPAATPIAALIDQFLAGPKRLAGRPVWRSGNGSDDKRVVWPILVGTSVSEATLGITAYPNRTALQFTITLNLPPCIWRLDFIPPQESHSNPLDRGSMLGYRVYGPHYHAWADNRHLATAATLPKVLLCARSLPRQITKWDQAFRWFCAAVGIALEPDQVIDLPPREGLF